MTQGGQDVTSKEQLKKRIAVRERALENLYSAYEALSAGGVKSYTIDDRELTRYDLPDLLKQIEALENWLDQANAQLKGRSARLAFGVIPRDW